MTPHTVALYVAPIVSTSTDHLVVTIGGQQVTALRSTATRPVLLVIDGQTVAL